MDPAKLKVVELRAQLSQRGLDTKGNKAVLVERLRKALEEETESPSQESTVGNTEDFKDGGNGDSREKSVEPSKSTQPPKTPGRSSRSSTLTTPSKVATRSNPRSTSASSRSSPSKAQCTEKSSENLATLPEPVREEPIDIERDRRTPERKDVFHKTQEGLEVSAAQDEAHEPDPGRIEKVSEDNEDNAKKDVSDSRISDVVKESPEKSDIREQQAADKMDNVPQSTETNINDTSVKLQESVSTPKDVESDNVRNVEEDTFIKRDEPEAELEASLKENGKDEEMREDAKAEREEESHNTENSTKMENDVQNVDYIRDDQKYIEDKKDDEQMIQDQEFEQDEKMDDSDAEHKEQNINEDTKPLSKQESTDESMDNNNAFTENEEDVVAKETKSEENLKSAPIEAEHTDHRDRKRKRSPSPAEERQMSPAIEPIEDEPEIDDSAVVLSWYDSDLNLVIDKEGYLSATPMHNGGFCYVWAGARASYGVTNGKIYYETKVTEHCPVSMQDENHPHVLRVGWSASETSMQLGEERLSYGYDSTGKKSTDNEFTDYGSQFNKDDVVGCYLDASEESVTLSYTVNGKDLGTAFSIPKEELGNKPLFPHVLSKNCSFVCNFGQEEPWSSEILSEYVPVLKAEDQNRIAGPRRPDKKEDCEVIMMCGLPAAGKTFWASKYTTDHPERMYNVLGMSSLIDKMKDMGMPRKQVYRGRWETFVDKCTQSLNKLIEVAASRRRNYILDQVNVYSSAQRRKMRNFCGYQRKAVIVVPSDEEMKSRSATHVRVEGKEVSNAELMEMKANFTAPVAGEFFESVEWVELDKNEGQKVIEKYNKEGREAGFGQQQTSKRPRFERPDNVNRDNRDNRNNRDNRDNRDYRDRRNNYPDRNRNQPWRMGDKLRRWRDRQHRGGHMRHGGGFLPPCMWRGRGMPIPPPHRGMDRRGIGDRRPMNDRNRSTVSRQGGSWGPMSNYQGSSQSNWCQQGNWSGGQSQQQGGGWGQDDWGQQQHQTGWGNNWKPYGQGSYSQSNYNQHGYDNGNWNSWNQQYYNQYWDQQQQTGQTTAAGGQAASTTEGVSAESNESGSAYNYTQEWQGYTQDFNSAHSATTNAQESQQHK